jgi:hypothetical protein
MSDKSGAYLFSQIFAHLAERADDANIKFAQWLLQPYLKFRYQCNCRYSYR